MTFSKADLLPWKILKVLLAACLAAPFFVWSGVIFPYTVPKVFGFYILVEIAFVFYLYLALKYFKFWPKKTFLFLAVLFFLAVYFLASLRGVDFYLSFWGTLERGLGFFGLAHFFIWFLMLVSVFKIDEKNLNFAFSSSASASGKKDKSFLKISQQGFFKKDFKNQPFSRRLIIFSVFVSAAISFLAIGQHFFSLGDLLPQNTRSYSLIGNAGLLGSYLLFNVFFAIYLFLVSEKKIKWFWAAGIFVIILALFLTGTRGAYLGLFLGFFVFLVMVAWRAPQKKWQRGAVAFLGIIMVLGGVLFWARQSAVVKNNFVFSRLSAISWQETTAQNRLILWQSAWRAWQEKPFLGWGGENFEVAINKYFDPRLTFFEAWYDRAHNFIFDYGVTLGYLGLFSYLLIMGLAFYQLLKQIKTDFFLAASFLALLTAYLVQNFFIFDSFVSYLMLFFVLAVIDSSNFLLGPLLSLGKKAKEEGALIFDEKSRAWKNSNFSEKPKTLALPFYKKIILLFFGGFLFFVSYNFNLKPLLAAHYANKILSLETEQADEILPYFKEVLALKPVRLDEIVYQVVLDYQEKINQNPALAQNEEFYNLAKEQLEKGIKRPSFELKNSLALAWLNLYFSGQNKARLADSLKLAQRVLKLAPGRKDGYLLLVAGYVLSGETEKAQQIVDLAISLNDKMGEEIKKYYERLK